MATEPLVYEGLEQTFLAAFPELVAKYKEKFDYWVDWDKPPGSYLIFGLLVFPQLAARLGTNQNDEFLGRLFKFFEEMANSSDSEVVNLLNLEIVQKLLHDPYRLSLAWSYMGEETKKLARKVARVQHCEKNLPRA